MLCPNMCSQVLDVVELRLTLNASIADYVNRLLEFCRNSGSLFHIWSFVFDYLYEVVAVVIIIVWRWFRFYCFLVGRWQKWEAADILKWKDKTIKNRHYVTPTRLQLTTESSGIVSTSVSFSSVPVFPVRSMLFGSEQIFFSHPRHHFSPFPPNYK